MLKENMKFKSPLVTLFGNNALSEIGANLEKLQIKKAMIVTDKVIVKIGIAEKIIGIIKEQTGIECFIYDGVMPEPDVENAYEAYEIYQKNKCNGVIGVGGGSPLDVAKAVALLATNEGKYEDYAGIGKVKNRCAPLVLIPTTSGTGSEVSMFSIMMVNGSKAGVVDENIIAHVALIDPELTVSVPRKLTASTGLDAFCHLLEGFLSVNYSLMHKPICLEGMKMIGKYLRKAVGDGTNLEARYYMAYASMLGGYSSNLSEGAAANHGAAFALGAVYHIGHGLANAVMLRHVLPIIGLAELEKVRMVGEALGEDLSGYSDVEALEITVAAVKKLVSDVGCDIPLRDFGAKESDLDKLVEETNKQTRVMGHSTYSLSSEEIREIFSGAL